MRRDSFGFEPQLAISRSQPHGVAAAPNGACELAPASGPVQQNHRALVQDEDDPILDLVVRAPHVP
jgi:hypothetical protein